MTRYFASALMLVATSLFVAGCGSGADETPGGDGAGGQDAVTPGDVDTTPDAIAPDPGGSHVTGSAEGSGVEGGDSGDRPGPGDDASASDGKKSVLGALGRAVYRGAAGAAKEE